MKILVIGGTGHVGSFLCEILKSHGHEVVIASRGNKSIPDGYKGVICNSYDKDSLMSLKSENFDTIVDFPGTALNVYNALGDTVKHIVACGSIWMLGLPKIVPTPEIPQNTCIFDGYRERFSQINEMIAKHKCPVTAVFPPNICGPGKIPIDGLGGRDINVHKAHKNGETVYLPDGPEALIAPCDAYDIAMLFALCIEQPEKSGNQIFNAGTEHALTTSELIKLYAKIYKTEIPIEYVSWEKYKNEISPSIGYWWHFYSHMCPDISKAKNLLGYQPKYSSESSVERAVKWMFDNKML